VTAIVIDFIANNNRLGWNVTTKTLIYSFLIRGLDNVQRQLSGAKVVSVSYDDSNIHLQFDNGLRLSLAAENYNKSDYVWPD
jgi:hypothetical protein